MFLNKEDFCPLSIFRNRKVLNTATHFFVTRTHLVLGNYGEESDIFKMYSAIADGDNQSSLGNDSCHAGITNHCSGMIFRHSGMAPAARESFLSRGNDNWSSGNDKWAVTCYSREQFIIPDGILFSPWGKPVQPDRGDVLNLPMHAFSHIPNQF